MINIKDSQIGSLLPDPLSNAKITQAIAYALNKQMRYAIEKADNTRIWSMIDSLPSKLLDILAVELRTHYYNETYSIDVKRQLIKNTLYRYQKAATPDMVNELIKIVLGDGRIEEWFEYGGKPHWFRVIAYTGIGDTLSMQEFLRMLEKTKRKSSHLGEVIVEEHEDIKLNFIVVNKDYTIRNVNVRR